MLRTLVIALLLANAAFFAWTQGWLDAVVDSAAHAEREPQRLGQQVHPEAVRLLPAHVALAASAPPATRPLPRCAPRAAPRQPAAGKPASCRSLWARSPAARGLAPRGGGRSYSERACVHRWAHAGGAAAMLTSSAPEAGGNGRPQEGRPDCPGRARESEGMSAPQPHLPAARAQPAAGLAWGPASPPPPAPRAVAGQRGSAPRAPPSCAAGRAQRRPRPAERAGKCAARWAGRASVSGRRAGDRPRRRTARRPGMC